MKKLYIILGVIGALVVLMVMQRGPGGLTSTTATGPVPVEGLDDMQRLVEIGQGVTMGNADAGVTIVEFGDYQCPGCGMFATLVEPLIEAEYVESGEVKFVFYDFPITEIHPNAFLAHRAARCAQDQSRYWDYHDMLFGNQVSWSGSSNPANMFVGYAGQIGLDEGAFEGCLKSDQHAETVTANMALGVELGVSSTPTIMVSQGQGMAQRVSGASFEAIAAVVNEMLGRESDPGGGRP